MRKPRLGKQRSASGAFSLSRSVPKLKMPLSAAAQSTPRSKPKVGKPNPARRVTGGRNG